MTKLYYKSQKVNNFIRPKLEDGLLYLGKAKSSISNSVIPNSFVYNNKTRDCFNKINSVLNDLKKVEKLILDIDESLIKLTNELEEDCLNLPTSYIEDRGRRVE